MIRAKRKNVVTEQFKKWYQRFNEDFNLEDDCSDASRKFDNNEIEELLNENPTLTQKELAERLGITRQTVSN